MTLREFTLLLRKVARIVPSLATDEEIATIFELAQDEQKQTKKQRQRRPGAGSELWSQPSKPSRQSLLRSEREHRDAKAGFVSGLELAQLIQDLLGESDFLLQQAPERAPPAETRSPKQRKAQQCTTSHLKQTARRNGPSQEVSFSCHSSAQSLSKETHLSEQVEIRRTP
jgi:hypothetical protein